jgi:hypothetical protein
LASQPQDERELTLAAAPPPVRVDVDSGNSEIDFSPSAIRAIADLTPVEVHATPSSVTVYREVPSGVNIHA